MMEKIAYSVIAVIVIIFILAITDIIPEKTCLLVVMNVFGGFAIFFMIFKDIIS